MSRRLTWQAVHINARSLRAPAIHPIQPTRLAAPLQLEPAAQIITAEPDVESVELTPEDRFLVLACDGIWDVMDK